ncbi:hypothetical protein BKG81_15130 [Mycobacteroides chelonae]|nr:hypothetical protein BKG81_15130 [Mycobacteroides chelonae]
MPSLTAIDLHQTSTLGRSYRASHQIATTLEAARGDLYGSTTITARLLQKQPIMFVATASLNKIKCGNRISEEFMILRWGQLIVLFVIHHTVTHRY